MRQRRPGSDDEGDRDATEYHQHKGGRQVRQRPEYGIGEGEASDHGGAVARDPVRRLHGFDGDGHAALVLKRGREGDDTLSRP